MVIFVKLTVNSRFQENKPLEPGELSTYCRSQECGNIAVVKLEKRVESKPALHESSVHQGADNRNTKGKKASLNMHYTVHRGCFGSLDR